MPMAELGPFQMGLQTKKEQANEALKLVNETLAKFLKNGVTEKELTVSYTHLDVYKRQCMTGLKRPPIMPVIPAIRPFSSMNSAVEMPISAPPASADQGVKLFQSIIISM